MNIYCSLFILMYVYNKMQIAPAMHIWVVSLSLALIVETCNKSFISHDH